MSSFLTSSSEDAVDPGSIIGKIVQVFSDGLVLVEYEKQPEKFVVEEFELDDLQFYTGTTLIQETLIASGWLDEVYILVPSDKLCEVDESESKYHRVIKLYQDFPHGRVYINRQIQIRVIKALRDKSEIVPSGEQEAVYLRACETGHVWFRRYIPFHTRILNFMEGDSDSSIHQEPETMESLLQRSEQELRKEIFLAPFREDPAQKMQRIRIIKLVYGKQSLRVNFIDFGIEEEIKLEKIYSAPVIDENYAYFPPLAVKFHLHGVAWLDINAFHDLVEGQELFIQLTDASQDNSDSSVAADIKLYAKENPEGEKISLEAKIISQGIGIPEVLNPRYSGLDWLDSLKNEGVPGATKQL